jgi:hypothetical protein
MGKIPNIKIIITFIRSGSAVLGIAASGDGGSSASTASIATSVSSVISDGSLGTPVLSSSVGVFY